KTKLLIGSVCAFVLSNFIQAAPPAFGQTNPIPTGSIKVELQNIATLPTGTTGAPDFLTTDGVASDNRLFVVGQAGQVRIVDNTGLESTPFLDLSTVPGFSLINSDERGLLGLAFSPDFNNPSAPGYRKVYTFTSENPGTATANAPTFTHPELGTGNGSTQSVVREWTVNATNPNVIDTSIPSRVLLRIRKPDTNHNGGGLIFGPDHDLYISTGDGGGGNDEGASATSTTDGHTNSVGNGQYRIPNSNPFASISGDVKEIYAYGLRNPFRFSFDSITGKLITADVGQGQREEIDVITNGGNFGWPFMEGTRDNSADTGRTKPTGFTSIAPIGEYTHADGTAAIGGYVYRGSEIPSLVGQYIFGDLDHNGVGRLFYMGINDPGPNGISEFQISKLGNLKPAADLHGFGQGPNGEVYAVFSDGEIMKFDPIIKGDFDHDFKVTNADLQAMLFALQNPTQYEASHNNLMAQDLVDVGDFNGDGQFTAADITPFMRVLTGQLPTGGDLAVPEPGALALAALGSFGVIGVWRRRRNYECRNSNDESNSKFKIADRR
ncbi:MAG TPA: PQQ-dependent sugar dehydrogenase, partial [Pirellulales bacterium]